MGDAVAVAPGCRSRVVRLQESWTRRAFLWLSSPRSRRSIAIADPRRRASRPPGAVPERAGHKHPWRSLARGLPVALPLLAAALPSASHASPGDLAPRVVDATRFPGGPALGRLSDRTLALALELDRDTSRLLAFTVKARPFVRPIAPDAARPLERSPRTQLELVLLDPAGTRYVQRLDVGALCLAHGPDDPPHIEGDTIRVHSDTFVVEVPELPGFTEIETAYYDEPSEGALSRHSLGIERLTPDRFDPAGGVIFYPDLAFADSSVSMSEAPPPTSGQVHWPEEFNDPDIYELHGNSMETDRRINIVIVPDGYTYLDKTLMQSHARSLIDYFRGKTPYREHDPFINYTLVYAYSNERGTDQCDCSIVTDTAMGTYFPAEHSECRNMENRCLWYGLGCDKLSSVNIALAELRAPARDATLVMVNTTRYGGCGGVRAVYAAGNEFAFEIAVHELAHSLGRLDDEYGGPGCGSSAHEVNTSVNSVTGAWPEWIAEIGPPREGAQYFDACLYRPESRCEMRSLDVPFCRVCNQQWGLVYFSHPRVAPSAPIESSSPASPLTVAVGEVVRFSVTTRLAQGPSVTNSVTWQVQGPLDAAPVTVASETATYDHLFAESGFYSVTCQVVADTNFIKPQRYGENRDVSTWEIFATATGGDIGTAVASFDVTSYIPGQPVKVTIAVTPGESTQSYVIEDEPPSGWTVAGIDNGGQFDALNGVVRWGPFGDNGVRALSYVATAPASETVTRSFRGVAWFDGRGVKVGGSRSISLAPLTVGPDLVGFWSTATQACKTKKGVTSCRITGKLSVQNKGTVSSGSTGARILLSADGTPSGDDAVIAFFTVNPLKPQKKKTLKLIHSLPSGTSAAGRYLVAQIDPNGSVRETSESNNVAVGGALR